MQRLEPKSAGVMCQESRGFSLIELLVVVAIILIVAGIAIPNLLRSKMSANEAAAVAVLRNVNNAEASYFVEYTSSIGYANTLIKLGPGKPCSKDAACLTDQLVGCVAEPCVKSGYEFYMTSTSGSEPFSTYTASGTPVVWASTGQKNFCTTEDGSIKTEKGASTSLGAGVIHSECIDATRFVGLGQ